MPEFQDFLPKRSYFQAIKHCLLKTNTLSFDTLTKNLRDMPKGSVHLLSCGYRGQGGGTAGGSCTTICFLLSSVCEPGLQPPTAPDRRAAVLKVQHPITEKLSNCLEITHFSVDKQEMFRV